MSKIQYAVFKISDILEKVPTKKLPLKAKQLPKVPDQNNTIPLIAAGVSNQGCVGYVNEKQPTLLQNMLTVSANGANSGATFYQNRTFSILQDAYPLKLVDKYQEYTNDQVYLYLATILNNRFQNNGYTDKAGWSRVKDKNIEIPVTLSGEPDFVYMEQRIKALEEQRIKALENYLHVAGLDNTVLTDKEKKALYAMKNGNVKLTKFKISDIFDEPQKGNVDLQKRDIDSKGEFFINSGTTNYGIKGKTSRKAKIFEPNTITIDFLGNAYYRDFKYKLATHDHVFSFSSKYLKSEKIGLFFVSSLSFLKQIYGYNNMLNWSKIKDSHMILPATSTGEVDLNFMETYISGIEKESIKDVITYKDKVISTTKNIVNNDH